MTDTHTLLMATIVAGFVVLALMLAAFAIGREGLGVLILLLATGVFVVALVLMGRLSVQEQQEARDAVLAKYDVRIQQWGPPLGVDPEWKVDGKVSDCAVDLDDPEDPVVTCGGQELRRR